MDFLDILNIQKTTSIIEVVQFLITGPRAPF